MIIKYDISAISSFSNVQNLINIDKEFILTMNETIEMISKEVPDVELHVLTNPFTEPKFSVKMGEGTLETNSPFEVFMDSGGLQMVTTKEGAKITDMDAVKQKTYDIQAGGCDYGMSFDEIPREKLIDDVIVGGNGLDGNSVVAIKDRFKPNGLKANKNLIDHLETFKRLDARGKVLPIIQTLGVQETLDYSDGLFDNITPDLEKYIGGISLGGLMSDSIISLLPPTIAAMRVDHPIVNKYRKEMVHYLGVGAIKRIIPIIIMQRNGLIDTEFLSFDSSRTPQMYTFGKITDTIDGINVVCEKMGYLWTPEIEALFKKIWDTFEPIMLKYYDSFEDYKDYTFHWGEAGKKIREEKNQTDLPTNIRMKYYLDKYFVTMYSTRSKLITLEKIYNGELNPVDLFNNRRDKQIIALLTEAKTLDDVEKLVDMFYSPSLKVVANDEELEHLKNPLHGWI